jgi:hypothetical protein
MKSRSWTNEGSLGETFLFVFRCEKKNKCLLSSTQGDPNYLIKMLLFRGKIIVKGAT